jgi:putative DNA primase/helicase
LESQRNQGLAREANRKADGVIWLDTGTMSAPEHADLTIMRLNLLAGGYDPIPIVAHDAPGKSPGKRPALDGWQGIEITPDVVRSWAAERRAGDVNTGIRTGKMAGVDIDVLIQHVAEQIHAMATAMLGPTPLLRVGRAPKRLLCYRTAAPIAKVATSDLIMPDGSKAKVEILGVGQQCVCFGTHPDTRKPYEWQGESPLDVPLAALPLVAEQPVLAFVAAAEAVLRSAGGRTKKELKAEKDAKKGSNGAAWPKRSTAGASFFRQVNDAALANLGPWVARLFPRAEFQEGTGAYRVRPADLGRGCEEDLSIHPNGIQDWGEEKGLTPIDAMVAFGGAASATDAAIALCEMIGRQPAEFGWNEPRSKGRPPPSPRANGEDHAEADTHESEPLPDDKTQLPTIRYSAGKLDVLTDQAEAALLQAGADVYQRAENLVRPGFMEVSAADNRTTKAAGLYPVDGSALLEELQRVATWEHYDARSKSWVTINPPTIIARVLAARKGNWKIRSVLGVITAPTLRPDGSVIDTPGYDAKTRLFYAPHPGLKMPPVPINPTKDDAVAALKVFSDLLHEFPFVAEQDKAVGLSLPISAVTRGAFSMVPVHAFSAPTPGSGKSYLADLTSTIISGRWCPVIAPGYSEEELEKRLGAMVLAGHSIISLDNCSTEITGDALCQISERPIVRIRILGKSETPECEFRGILIANGNNLVISGDMVRRVLLAMLDSGLERPEDRTFKANPVAQILKDRGRYIAAAITIVRAYLTAGLPEKLSPLASYAEWSDMVRSPLVWLGCTDPVATMLAVRAADRVLTTLASVLLLWAPAFGEAGKTAAEVSEAYQGFDPNSDTGQAMTELRPTLAAVAGVHGIIDANRLGYWLRTNRGRPAGGLKFSSETAHAGAQRWFSLSV